MRTLLSSTMVLLLGTSIATAGSPLTVERWSPADIDSVPGVLAIKTNGREVLVFWNSSAFLYDPVLDNTTPTSPPLGPFSEQEVVLLDDGRILAAGGSYRSGRERIPTHWAETYDRATESWTAAAPMRYGRRRHSATLLDDSEVLAAGGETDEFSTPTDRAELYDPALDRWSEVGRMRMPRAGHTATRLPDGRVLVVGGDGSAWSSAEIYDPDTEAWYFTDPPIHPRLEHTATSLQDGTVLVTGGISSSSERYHPVTNVWFDSRNLNDARQSAPSTLMDDGRVIVLGGVSGPVGLGRSTEIYDPSTGLWSTGPLMDSAHSQKQALRLNSGEVLVIGPTYSSDPHAERLGPTAAPTVFIVDDTLDTVDSNPGDGTCSDGGGRCTLRAAVMEANALPGENRIELPAGRHTLTLAGTLEDGSETGDIDILEDLEIVGAGAASTVIEGDGVDGVVEIRAGTATLRDLTIENQGTGDGILVLSDALLVDCAVRRTRRAILATAPLTMYRCLVTENDTRSLQSGSGAGLFLHYGGHARIYNSTFSDNHASGSGGAIYVLIDSTLLVHASTITNNSADRGGGIYHWCEGHHCPGKVIRSTIVYDNSAPDGPDCQTASDYSELASFGYNLVGPGCLERLGPEDIVADLGGPLDPLLMPLANNGGETETHALMPGSPAIDLVPQPHCTGGSDQTLAPRRQGPACDVGAFEAPEPRAAALAFAAVTTLVLLTRYRSASWPRRRMTRPSSR